MAEYRVNNTDLAALLVSQLIRAGFTFTATLTERGWLIAAKARQQDLDGIGQACTQMLIAEGKIRGGPTMPLKNAS